METQPQPTSQWGEARAQLAENKAPGRTLSISPRKQACIILGSAGPNPRRHAHWKKAAAECEPHGQGSGPQDAASS